MSYVLARIAFESVVLAVGWAAWWWGGTAGIVFYLVALWVVGELVWL